MDQGGYSSIPDAFPDAFPRQASDLAQDVDGDGDLQFPPYAGLPEAWYDAPEDAVDAMLLEPQVPVDDVFDEYMNELISGGTELEAPPDRAPQPERACSVLGVPAGGVCVQPGVSSCDLASFLSFQTLAANQPQSAAALNMQAFVAPGQQAQPLPSISVLNGPSRGNGHYSGHHPLPLAQLGGGGSGMFSLQHPQQRHPQQQQQQQQLALAPSGQLPGAGAVLLLHAQQPLQQQQGQQLPTKWLLPQGRAGGLLAQVQQATFGTPLPARPPAPPVPAAKWPPRRNDNAQAVPAATACQAGGGGTSPCSATSRYGVDGVNAATMLRPAAQEATDGTPPFETSSASGGGCDGMTSCATSRDSPGGMASAMVSLAAASVQTTSPLTGGGGGGGGGRRNMRVLVQNKFAQARYRERQKERTHAMARTISDLQTQLRPLGELERRHQDLLARAEMMEKKLQEKCTTLASLQQAAQRCTHGQPSRPGATPGAAKEDGALCSTMAADNGREPTAGPTAAVGITAPAPVAAPAADARGADEPPPSRLLPGGGRGAASASSSPPPGSAPPSAERSGGGVGLQAKHLREAVAALHSFMQEQGIADGDAPGKQLLLESGRRLAQLVKDAATAGTVLRRMEGVQVPDLMRLRVEEVGPLEANRRGERWLGVYRQLRMSGWQVANALALRTTYLSRLQDTYRQRQQLNQQVLALLVPDKPSSEPPQQQGGCAAAAAVASAADGERRQLARWLSINGYLYSSAKRAEVEAALEQIRDNLQTEQQLISEANYVMLVRVLSVVQAGRFLLACYPQPFNCLALVNALASASYHNGDAGRGGGGANTAWRGAESEAANATRGGGGSGGVLPSLSPLQPQLLCHGAHAQQQQQQQAVFERQAAATWLPRP